MFAVMLTERGLGWYSELLRLSLMNTDDTRDLKINPRNCIGTVLALNGHRKYFCMYHAKHPESSRGTRVRKFILILFFIKINYFKFLAHAANDKNAQLRIR